VAAAGGTVLVQDPADAVVASMPEAALRAVPAAAALAAGDIGAALVAFAEGLADVREHPPEAAAAPESTRPPASSERPSWPPSGLMRPKNRRLGRRDAGGAVQSRCRLGHAYGEDVLLEANGGEVEAAMWSAADALGEYTEVLRTVAARTLDAGRVKAAAPLRRRAERPDVVRSVLDAAADPGRGPETA
jgi:two-component system chemotaxis response regulator CheB